MRLLHDPLKISACFDDPNLVSRAGLVPVMSLAERAGLGGLVRRRVQITAKTGVYPEGDLWQHRDVGVSGEHDAGMA